MLKKRKTFKEFEDYQALRLCAVFLDNKQLD
jgi:hypothetical protein